MLARILNPLLFLVTSLCAQDWQLVWSDEFDGSELDASKWEPMIGDGCNYGICGWGNNELEYYKAENATVEDGYLVITAKEETISGKDYTSARIRTLNKEDWKYGRFEFRAKFPVGKGLWPAIWMLPSDNVYGGWAASGEIDIVEYLGDDTTKVHGTIHYGGSWPNNQYSGTSYTLQEGSFSGEFHEFALEWEEGVIKWFIDDSLYQTQTSWFSTGGEFPAPLDQRFHLLINLAVGGNWPGSPDSATTFPQKLEVDYVRVYQKDLSTSINDNNVPLPLQHSLSQNYPNPFNPTTSIQYDIAKNGFVRLTVYDIAGKVVSTLVNGHQNRGSYTVLFDASLYPSGVYLW